MKFGFKHAFNGLFYAIKHERNFKIHLLVFVVVGFFGIICSISKDEWLTIFVISAIVFGLELMNTAIEKLCDLYTTDYNKTIKIIKDVSAGAVLIAAIFAVIIG